MKRRHFLKAAGVIGGLCCIPQRAWMQALIPQAGEWTPLRRNIGYYTNRGGTIGCLLSSEHCVVVDTQFPDQANELIKLLRQTNSQPIDLLVNTHHHGDHTAGNIAFQDLFRTHVAHANSKINQERSARENDRMDGLLLPSTTYDTQWSQRIGDETIRLHYFGPGHTNGDSLVHFEEANVVHMGDLMFNRRFPYVDKGAGADIGNWIQVLKKARKTFDRDTIYIFGHAGEGYPVEGTADDLKAMENFLKRSLKYVRIAKRKGQSLEGLISSTETIPGATDYKVRGVQRVLNAAWEEID